MATQSKEELEEWWTTPDAWGYQTHPDDQIRKDKILKALKPHKFLRALDIGCGEGWITKSLPAKSIYGIEISDNASNRVPKKVKMIESPKGQYDLVIATGVLYEQYPFQNFLTWIRTHASHTVLTCNIKDWEKNDLDEKKQIYYEEFPYREYVQALRVYRL